MRVSGRASVGTLREMVVRFVATHGSRRPMKDWFDVRVKSGDMLRGS